MKKIFVRSPYFIQINPTGQIGSKVELRFRKAGQSFPTDPNYVLSKKIPSLTQINTVYNISNYAREFIKAINITNRVFEIESTDLWCFMEVKRYKQNSNGTFTLLNTEEFACLDGFTNYTDGVNKFNSNELIPLFNTNIPIQRQVETDLDSPKIRYVNAYLEIGTYTLTYNAGVNIDASFFKKRVLDDNGTFEAFSCLANTINDLGGGNNSITLTVANAGVYKLPLYGDSLRVEGGTIQEIAFDVLSPIICEPKYTPVECVFINRFGGWQPLTFFKAKSESYEMQSVKHKLMPEFVNYNTSVGQYKQFNFNGKQSVKLNTGYVPESYSELIMDLMLSETILLDNHPAIIKSQSIEIKSNLVDKLINYEVEFEYNYNLINTVQ